MIFAYENKNIAISQISDLCKDRKYKAFKIDKTFVMEKPEEDIKKQLLATVKNGDTVITSTLVNFSHVILDVMKTLKPFFDKGVRVISVLEDFDSAAYDAKVFQEVYDVLDEYSKLSHQSKIATLKRNGRCFGRKPLSPLNIPNFENFYQEYKHRKINKEQFSRLIEVSRPTLDKLIKRYLDQEHQEQSN